MTGYARMAAKLVSKQNAPQKHGLTRLRAYLRSLGNPQDSFKSVHVTGTNGKGSVCAMTAEILRRSGCKTGLFISPHLADIRERIQIDGVPISRARFAGLLKELERTAPFPLTFFETLACAAFLHFARERVDYAVIEVGIGGRLDATNTLHAPEAAVITSIGLDHTVLLGGTVEKIAFEKAGIIKPGIPCVHGKLPAAALSVLRAKARACRSALRAPSGKNAFRPAGTDWDALKLRIRNKKGERFQLNLLGAHQALNASVAAETADILREKGAPITAKAVRDAFAGVYWPGRFQVLRRGGKIVVLDGGHNPEAALFFSKALSDSPLAGKKPVLVLGMLKDKDCRAIVSALRPHLSRVIATAPPSERALAPTALAELVLRERPDAEIEVHGDCDTALRCGLAFPCCAVAGSFYLVGAALRLHSSAVKKPG
ncbi:MAG: bifunctional folylpolyglutamate synthase/dihydrofolate synthase [Elusimicrobia bacterium]|nr:bifunctional folylpolyglutamate synthase/dihydrofolate synthase [Elusimicrobiota bacterium]